MESSIPLIISDTDSVLNPLKVGDIIRFGNFDWRVLCIKNNKILIISNLIIEKRQYHHTYTDTSWAECELRSYLNGSFYNKFISQDKARIIETKIITNDNPCFGTKGCGETIDKIFLLSVKKW